jgi:hypothetical protein
MPSDRPHGRRGRAHPAERSLIDRIAGCVPIIGDANRQLTVIRLGEEGSRGGKLARLRTAPRRVAAAGFAFVVLGTAILISVAAQSVASAQGGSPPTTLTGAYELYCPGTPVGNIALNDATTSATLSPAAPSAGQSFTVTGYQTMVNLPASLASAAAAVSPTLSGSATTQIDASGATPATTAQGPLTFSVTPPSPVPTGGVPLTLPSTPATISGFTATSSDITIQEDSAASLSLTVAGSALALTCTAYPNDTVTPSGITTTTPTAAPIAPVIAVAGGGTSSTTTTTGATTTTTGATTTTTGAGTTTTTAPSTTLTGAYELFCPGTPVGDVVLNDATTSATLSPAAPSAGQSFSVTGYQTMVNLPASLATAAAAVSPTLSGSATTQIDASGATPATTPHGPLSFNLPFPSPIPTDGVPLTLPSTAATVSGFTATSSDVTIQEDSAASLSLTVAGSALSLTCTAYPNDSVTPSGITTTTPTAAAIAPVIAVAGGGSSTTTTGATTTSTLPVTTTTLPPASTTTLPPASTTTTPGSTTSTSQATTSSTSTTTGPTTATTSATTSATTTSTAAPAVTSGTEPPSASGSSGTASPASRIVTAPSGSLAFTGTGPGLKSATLLGIGAILFGMIMLLLVDIPRRVLRQLALMRGRNTSSD